MYFWIKQVPEKWVVPLWELYEESLTIDESIQEQRCFDRDSFIAALRDDEYVKGLLAVDDMPVAFIMGTNNLEKARVCYINPDFVRNRFPEAANEGRFFYMPCVFTSSKLRNAGFVRQMVTALVDAIQEKNWVLSLDTSDTRVFLADVLVKIGNEVGVPIEKHLMGRQSYFAFSCEEPAEQIDAATNESLSQARN